MAETIYSYEPQDSMSLWFIETPSSPVLIGELTLIDRARGVSLRYEPDWLTSGFPLSEDLPLTDQLFIAHESNTAPGAVDDARPDRWGERVIRVLDKPRRLSLLEYLYFTGDDRFGALGVSLSKEAYAPKSIGALPAVSDVARIHELVRKVAAGEAVDERERRLVNPGRSMGGAKPKSLIAIDGAEWVLKFADEYDHDWPLIEHAAMVLGESCGIRMCETRAINFSRGKSAIAVRRFDRAGSARNAGRIHCLSAGVVLRAAGEELGYPELASVIRRLGSTASVSQAPRELFKRMVFNILCDNTDDHEKNHALVQVGKEGRDRYALSPAFDVVPSMQNLRHQAIRVGAYQMDSTLDNAMSESAAFGLSRDQAATLIRAVCRKTANWRESMTGTGVSVKDLDALEPFLDGEKATMRREFVRPSAR